MTNSIRNARPDDVSAITDLVHAAYAPWIEVIGATPGPMLDDYVAAVAAGTVRVVENSTGLIAVLVLIPQDDALLLDNMAIRPDAQGQGLSQCLMQVAEDVALSRGFDHLRLYSHEKMASNIALYERRGFAITKRVTERGLHRVYMEKLLG